MSGHLNKLQLACAAGGEALDSEPAAHLEGCTDCRAQVAALTAAAEKVALSEGMAATWARLERRPTPRRWVWAIAPLAAAAGLAAFMLISTLPKGDGNRLKGPPVIEVMKLDDGSRVTDAHPGDRVFLQLDGSGGRHAVVVAVDAQGAVDVAWSGALKGGANRLEPPFAVTPGSVRVHAFIGAEPLDAAAVKAHVEAALKGAADPLAVEPGPAPGETARASATLKVD